MGTYNPRKYQVDLERVPNVSNSPGPKSRELHARATKYFRGLSGQVRLFPVALVMAVCCAT